MLQAFDAEGKILFDDVEERCRLDFNYGELDGMVKHVDSLSAAHHALANTVKTKNTSVGDSLSSTLEV